MTTLTYHIVSLIITQLLEVYAQYFCTNGFVQFVCKIFPSVLYVICAWRNFNLQSKKFEKYNNSFRAYNKGLLYSFFFAIIADFFLTEGYHWKLFNKGLMEQLGILSYMCDHFLLIYAFSRTFYSIKKFLIASVAVVTLLFFVIPFHTSLVDDTAMKLIITVYCYVISLMVALSFASKRFKVYQVLGAVVFYISDNCTSLLLFAPTYSPILCKIAVPTYYLCQYLLAYGMFDWDEEKDNIKVILERKNQ